MADRSPPRQSRNDISPPRNRPQQTPMRGTSPPRPQHSPPRPTKRTAMSPPRVSRPRDVSPPRGSRSVASPPRQPHQNNVSPPRPTRNTNISPPRPTVSPPRPARVANTNPQPQTNKDRDFSPPRMANARDNAETIREPRSGDDNDQHDQWVENDDQIEEKKKQPERDLWTEVSTLLGRKRYNLDASQRQISKIDQNDLPSRYQDPLYVASLASKKEKIIKLDEKKREKGLLQEQYEYEQYQIALKTQNYEKIREYEHKIAQDKEIELHNIDHFQRIQALKIPLVPIRDFDSGKLIKITKRPRYKPPPGQYGTSYSNRFNIPPGYRWDGVDRSINGIEKKKMN